MSDGYLRILYQQNIKIGEDQNVRVYEVRNSTDNEFVRYEAFSSFSRLPFLRSSTPPDLWDLQVNYKRTPEAEIFGKIIAAAAILLVLYGLISGIVTSFKS